MTPKETAIKLFEKFFYKMPTVLKDKTLDCTAQECALIAVEFARENPLNTHGYNKYLNEVKQEIKKL